MNDFAQAVTAVSMGTLLGFLGVGAMAQGLNAIEATRCPGITRIQVNTGTMLKDWASYGVCPRDGRVTPLKP